MTSQPSVQGIRQRNASCIFIQVTLFGQSAGAQAVTLHFLCDDSENLFHRGIIESNPAVFPYKTFDESLDVTNRLLDLLDCSGYKSNMDCLRYRLTLSGGNPWILSIFTEFLEALPLFDADINVCTRNTRLTYINLLPIPMLLFTFFVPNILDIPLLLPCMISNWKFDFKLLIFIPRLKLFVQ